MDEHTRTDGDRDDHSAGLGPPAGQPQALRRLRRPTDNRMLAGVAAGLGDYFDIDPVVARLVFVGLGLYGGLGVVAYLVCWLLMPSEETGGAGQASAGHGDAVPRGGAGQGGAGQGGAKSGTASTVVRVVGIVLLVIVGLGVLRGLVGAVVGPRWGWPGSWSMWYGPVWPLRPSVVVALLLVGAGMLLYQAGSRRDTPAATSPAAPPPPLAQSEPPGDPSGRPPGDPSDAPPGDPSDGPPGDPSNAPPGDPSDGPGAPVSRDQAAFSWAGPPEGGDDPLASGGGAGALGPPSTSRETPGPSAAPRPPGSPLGRLTLAVALLATGSAALLDQAGVLHLRVGDVLAVGLLVIGAGLVVGAWWGRARWLIAVGFALLPLVVIALLLPLPRWQAHRGFDATTGDQLHRPTSLEQLREEYVLGTGRLVLDLSGVEIPPGEQPAVAVDMTAGQIEVVLPPDADAVIRASALVGAVRLPEWDGAGLVIVEEQVDAVGGDARILLDLSVRAGEITVRRPISPTLPPPEGAPPGTEATPEAERLPAAPGTHRAWPAFPALLGDAAGDHDRALAATGAVRGGAR